MTNRVKIIQLAINDGESREDRFLRVESYLEAMSREPASPLVVVLPEIWGTGFFNYDNYKAECEPLQGETYSRLAPYAERLGAYLVAGSILEKEGHDLYNTLLLIGPDGSLSGAYRKIHLFGYRSEEQKLMTPGSEIYVTRTRHGAWGFSICYDLRFPELYRAMIEHEVDCIFTVAAWPRARVEHWRLLNRARAVENLGFMVSCNCAGNLKGVAFGGNSLVVDPWGEILASAGFEEEVLTAEISPRQVDEVRAEFPALADRKIGC